MTKLIKLMFVLLSFSFLFSCQNDFEQIEEKEEIALPGILSRYWDGHISTVLDRGGSSISDKAWEDIYKELNVFWMLYPGMRRMISDMERIRFKVKFRFEPKNPNLTDANPAYYERETETIVLKSERHVERTILLHEFLHAAQHATMGNLYITRSSMRNVEFEVALMMDLLDGKISHGCHLNSPQMKSEYDEWWMIVRNKSDITCLFRFNEFAENFFPYLDVPFDTSFEPSFLIIYWLNCRD